MAKIEDMQKIQEKSAWADENKGEPLENGNFCTKEQGRTVIRFCI